MKNIFENLFLSKEVKQAMMETKLSVEWALEATQMIESLYVSKRLAAMFGDDSAELADVLKEDYYAELLVGRMLREDEQKEGKELIASF